VGEDLDQRLLNRMLFFTDAVFAIVLTLLVLELRPPPFDNPLGNRAAILGMASRLFAFGMSFTVGSIFWIAHLHTTRRMIRFDWAATVANLAFLFPICLLPFASAWFGRGFDNPFPWGLYCSTMVLTSIANIVLVLVLSRGGGRLVGGVTRPERLYRAARAASPGIAFSLALLIMFAGFLHVSQFAWVAIWPIILVIERTLKPKPATPAAEPAP
jgi:uncharacterized membrane protein